MRLKAEGAFVSGKLHGLMLAQVELPQIYWGLKWPFLVWFKAEGTIFSGKVHGLIWFKATFLTFTKTHDTQFWILLKVTKRAGFIRPAVKTENKFGPFMKAEKWLLKWPFCGKHETQLMFRKAVNTEVTKNKLYKALKNSEKVVRLVEGF